VVGDDLLFASILRQDLQQPCAEASLVIRIRSRKQLLNSGHRREHFHDGNIMPDEPQRNNVLLESTSVERPLEEGIMPLDESLLPVKNCPRIFVKVPSAAK
jgi:hypothetical protein